MSWDVVVLNYNGAPPTDWDDADDPETLGSAAEVRERISQHLDGVDWSDPTFGVYVGSGFTIEFPIRDQDPVDSLMLYVRGKGDAITALLQFAEPNGWSLLDASNSEFIDPENPSQEGWEGFQRLGDAP